jgi:hypothetical protein
MRVHEYASAVASRRVLDALSLQVLSYGAFARVILGAYTLRMVCRFDALCKGMSILQS